MEAQPESSNSKVDPSNFRKWMPALMWMGCLFVLSTTFFSAANTGKIIEPILRYLFPAASAATIGMAHGLVRKAAHFTNYGILFWLLIRGPMEGRPYAALGFCVFYALLDEGHQIFVPGRTASLYDVAIDSSGALFSRFLNAAVAEIG
ncbi:MAG TPA: VanZ family protein [Candidatus Binataceae bacterium]|nr:VanZ family protein [Candidatus Binataceae bacterium]